MIAPSTALLGFDDAAPATGGGFPAGVVRAGMQVAFPFGIDPHGHVATAEWEAHVVQMIEQVLFTAPGERVNRPDFGCGVMELVFADESDALVTATQFLVQGSLQRWLGELITVAAVRVQAEDSTLAVTVQYTLRAGGGARSAVFRRGGGRP
ncbi:MAG TPA: GPW/gp25 family protein [Longimicrobium sp.]|nr:GPW/gp25 family protein [Longimicrobium sp.]